MNQSLFVFLGQYLPHLIIIFGFLILLTKKDLKFFLFCLFTALFSLSLSEIVKNAFYVPRPFLLNGIDPLLPVNPDSSFPSSHAATALAFALAFMSKKRYLLYALPITLGAITAAGFRIIGNVHSGIDVLGSFGISIFSFYVVKSFSSLILKANCRRLG